MLKTTYLKIAVPISGKTCPFPGSPPHGSWTCEVQEIPILGTSFLDEDAQSYTGEERVTETGESLGWVRWAGGTSLHTFPFSPALFPQLQNGKELAHESQKIL